MAKTIIATFADRKTADHTIRDLLDYGFRNDEISIISKDEDLYFEEEGREGTTLVESIATGLVAGSVIGGIIGFFVGTRVLTIAGAFSLMVNLPIVRDVGLVGAQATTAAGGIYGALIGALGGLIFSLLNPVWSRSYDRVQRGEETKSAVLALPVTERQEYEVKDIISEAGASNVKILDLKPYEEEEQYREYYGRVERGGGYGLAGVKGGKTRPSKGGRPRNDPARAGQDKYDDEF